MARQFPAPAAAFSKALRSFETGGFAYPDFLAELKELLAAGAPRDELLEILRRREVVEPLPEYARADVLSLLNGSPAPPAVPPPAAKPAVAKPPAARTAPPSAPKTPSPVLKAAKTAPARAPATEPVLRAAPSQAPLPLASVAPPPVAPVAPLAPRAVPRTPPAPMHDLAATLRPPGQASRVVPEESLSSQATSNPALAASQVTVPMPAPRPSHQTPDAYASIFMTPPAEVAPPPGPILEDGSLGATRERFVEALAEVRASGPPRVERKQWLSIRFVAWIFAIGILALAAWLMWHYAPAPATGPAALPP